MTPPTTNITESITYELGAIIDAIPDDAINSFASVDPSFKHGGFRPGQTAPVRKRLLAIATSDNVPLTDSLRRLLTRHSLNHTVVSRLSENTITELRHELAALFGTHRLILALQLDSRPEANKLAEHWLTNNTSFRSLSPQDAAQRLYNALGTICDACGTTGNGIATTKESWSDERRTLSEEIRDLRTQLRTLRSAEDRARNSQQQNETLTSELSSLKAALKEAESSIRTANNTIATLETQLADELKHRERRLQSALTTALATEFAGWLASGHAVETESKYKSQNTTDIIERATQALERQATVDRHSGNRTTIIARLDTLHQIQDRLHDALANAIVQTPELPLAAKEVEAEISRLENLIGITQPTTEIERTLHTRLHSANGNALYNINLLIERMQEFNTFDNTALERLNQAIAQRRTALMAIGAPPEGDAPEPVLALRRSLSGRSPAILLIDGHNLLFALQGRYMPASGAAVPDKEKRARLVADIVRVVSPHPTCRAWIVFDGPEPSEESPAPNVKVSYSGGIGDHRADKSILANIRYLRDADSTIPIILTSNDNELCGQARRLGALTIAATDIGALL
ncbi:MAG: hypothetical protein GX230_11335 [Lentisphaerae bacterium]|nr:hypothetical protein [Lentisphaerota bacterium]